MKYNYLIIIMFSFLANAQYNENAPWTRSKPGSSTNKKQQTVAALKADFDAYWLQHNRYARGSGYKPFMRWENYWVNNINDQGYIIPAEDFWNIWSNKQQFKSNRAALAAPVSNWEPVGPFTHTNTGSWSSGQGRVNYICVDPNNANTIYLGSPAGGIWKSTNAGVNWVPLSDKLPQIGISGIAVDHTNSNTIYIATGDKDSGDTYSVGVLKSTDGGLNWNTTGLTFSSGRAGDLIMHPTNNQILWCATNTGVWKTSNAGVNWVKVQNGSFAQGALRVKPNNPSIVYVVSGDKFYKSIDAGDTFTIITTGLPASSSRLLIDVSAAAPDKVFVLSANTASVFQGIYVSTNSGDSFTKTAQTANVFESTQSYYDLAFAVSQTNANEMYTGCLNIWKSTNGGDSFLKINSWSSPTAAAYTHADIHYLGFYGNKLYCGSDGGIYVSANSGVNFTDLTATAQISQFYRVAVSKQSVNNMVGGLQDNGGHGFSGGQWKNYYGADGMDTGINPNNPNLYYGFIQYGSSMYISSNGANSNSGSVSAPAAETGTNDDGGNWITPMKINSQGEVFSGYGRLYRLSGSTWVQQSTGTIGSGDIDVIEIAESNDNIMFVANGSKLYKSTDKGIVFNEVYTAPATINSIKVHSTNTSIVYLVTSGSTGKALQSNDGGVTFTNIANGLPNIGKNVIIHQSRNTKNPLYVGTSLGVYYKDDTMSVWEPFDTNLPNVAVRDLEINLADNKIVAATYGRGIWQASIPVEIPNVDMSLVQIISPTTSLSCNGTITPSLEIKNNGLNPLTSAILNYAIDSNNYTYNWIGNLLPQATTVVTLPSQSVARGNHTITIETTTTNDAYADNNTATQNFYSNDSGVIGAINTFTNTTTDALITTTEGGSGLVWQMASRTGAMSTGTSNTAYVTNTIENYPNGTKAYLVSQCYNLNTITNPQISFKMKYDLEENWDIVYIQYSTNLGANWSVLGNAGPNWYNSNRTPTTTGTDCTNCVGAQWTGSNTNYVTYSYPLNAFNTQSNIIFRIVFQSDESVNKQGVNVDDFVINGVLNTQNFATSAINLYPNPSSGIFTLFLGDLNPETIEVYDITGKIVYKNNTILVSEKQFTIDLTSISQGVYFVKIKVDNDVVVKRIMKQ